MRKLHIQFAAVFLVLGVTSVFSRLTNDERDLLQLLQGRNEETGVQKPFGEEKSLNRLLQEVKAQNEQKDNDFLQEKKKTGAEKSKKKTAQTDINRELLTPDLKELLRGLKRGYESEANTLAGKKEHHGESLVSKLQLKSGDAETVNKRLMYIVQHYEKLQLSPMDVMALVLAVTSSGGNGLIPQGSPTTIPPAPGNGNPPLSGDNAMELGIFGNEEIAKLWLDWYDKDSMTRTHKLAEIGWDYSIDMSEENKKKANEASLISSEWSKQITKIAKQFYAHKDNFEDPSIVRQLWLLQLTTALSDKNKTKEATEIGTQMLQIYSMSEACPHGKDAKCYSVEPGVEEFFRTSRNESEIRRMWEASREATGAALKDLFYRSVELSNEGARENGYSDIGEAIRLTEEEGGKDDLEENMKKLWKEVKPLYEQIHAYVRRKLREFYKDQGLQMPSGGTIPAHLLGNPWAQQWQNIFDIVNPYPDIPDVDVTDEMVKQDYNPLQMFKIADKFYQELGMFAMNDNFWNKSVIEKPKDTPGFDCHGSASDLGNRKDFRIKMCTMVNMHDFYVVHHEMGHIEYYMAYAHQPVPFHSGANPGFHEAVGDTMALSVMTTKHLSSLGLSPKSGADTAKKQKINFLLRMAIEKIPLLPWALTIDVWRWSYYRGDFGPETANLEWWKMRGEYQGLSPPVVRAADGFDPGNKYHIPAGVGYIRYFESFILQFMFHESACKLAGHTGPLHECDIQGSKEAGAKVKEMLSLGMSKPWPQALEVLTGKTDYDTAPLLKYFEPLHDWLKKENEGEKLGWDVEDATDMVL